MTRLIRTPQTPSTTKDIRFHSRSLPSFVLMCCRRTEIAIARVMDGRARLSGVAPGRSLHRANQLVEIRSDQGAVVADGVVAVVRFRAHERLRPLAGQDAFADLQAAE